MIIYLIMAHNDKDHGGDYPLDAFTDKKKAEEEVAYLWDNKPSCGQCYRRTTYSIVKVNLFGEQT